MCIIPLSQGYDTVKLGAIFSFSTTNGRVSKIAMEAARDDINSDPTILALRFMETDTVAIIGPQSSVLARVLSQITNELHTPLLSFTALDPAMSPRQYPYFIQTAPTDLYMVAAIADIISYYRWPEVILIYNDEDQLRNGMDMLHTLLLHGRSKLSYKAAISLFPTRSEVQEVVTKLLSMESCVVIVYTHTASGLLVFDVARSLGMLREGYVWIATSWLSNILDSGSVDAHNATFFHGVLTLRPHTPDSRKKRDFMQRWIHLSNGSIRLNPCGLYAYDTVWMIARAVRLFLDQGNNISFSDNTKLNDLSRGTLNLKALSKFEGGGKLRNIILQTNMNGLTGPFRFNSDRSVWHPSYDIINVVRGVSQDIGYWSNHSGLSVVLPETLYGKPQNRSSSNQHLSTVVWPGGGKVVPRGWIFPHNGKPLRIGIPNKSIFRRIVSADNGTNAVHGYCIDVFLAAIRLLPYELPYEFIPFGDGRKNPNNSELVNEIPAGVFDVVVGDISIVTDRTKVVDFTQPFIESGLVVVAPMRKGSSGPWSFLLPFTPSMWGILGLFFLIVGAVVWLLEHKRNDEFRGPPRYQFITVLWFSFSTLFMAHRESVESPLGRFVLIIWLFVILIVNSSYTASLTSILTVQQMASPISGIESLVSANVAIGYQVGSFSGKYLSDELNIAKNRLIPLGSQKEFARALSNGTVAAIVEEKPYAFKKDSPLAEDMSTAILRLSENGELERIGKKWLSKKLHCRVQSDSSDQLELESFMGLFLVCGIVCFVALLIYLCSTVRQFQRHCPVETCHQVGDESGGSASLSNGGGGSRRRRIRYSVKRVRRFMSYVDDKKDVWNAKRKRGEDEDDGKEMDLEEMESRRRMDVVVSEEDQQGRHFTMSLVWVVSVLLTCIIPLSQGYDTVKLGAIFAFSTANARISKIAMEAARDDINSDPTILGGRQLSITMFDSGFNGLLGFVRALRFMETDHVAIIGPQSPILVRMLSQIINELHTPLLSFTALDLALTPRQYPYFIQTAPNDLYLVTAIADIIRYYRWPEVIVIYNDADQLRNGMDMLHTLLLNGRTKISYKAAISLLPTRSEVQEVLTKLFSIASCVVIVYTQPTSGLLVFDVARSLGMLREGYVWIASTWLSDTLDSGSLDAHNATFFHGVLTLRPHTPDSKKKRDFVQRWDHLSNGSMGLIPCGLYAYDTVWMIARAVRLFLDQGNNISFSGHTRLNDVSRGTLNLKALSKFEGGEKLRNNILQTNMNGLTGTFRFNPDRSVWHPSFDIINVVSGVSQDIGYWSNHSGLSVVPPETLYGNPQNRSSSNPHLSTVVWLGGGKVVPRGWIFPQNGKPLRIGVPNKSIFQRIVSADNGTNAVHGYCIDVFHAAIRLLPYQLPYEFIPFGDGLRNPDYSELVKEIPAGVLDVVVGDISIVAHRTKIVDFSQPFMESGLVVVAPMRKLNSSVWSFLLPFIPSMWGTLGLFFLFVGAVVWLLEHKTNDEFRGPPRHQFVTVLWFSFSTLFMAHRQKVESPLGRFVLIIWLFVILIVNSSYTASLTSILTVQQMASPISGIGSLESSNVAIGYQVGSFSGKYLSDELNIARNRLIPLGSQKEFERALSNGTVAAMAFRKDFPLAEDMSTAILRLSENGELERIGRKWLSQKKLHCRVKTDSSDQLEAESFMGLFLVCGIVCFLALLIHLCSTVRQFKRHCPVKTCEFDHHVEDELGGSSSLSTTINASSSSSSRRRIRYGVKRVRIFMSYVDDKKDVWNHNNSMKQKRKRGEDEDDTVLPTASYEVGRKQNGEEMVNRRRKDVVVSEQDQQGRHVRFIGPIPRLLTTVQFTPIAMRSFEIAESSDLKWAFLVPRGYLLKLFIEK
ncbi:Glutamate receptor 3.2 [Linum grandiflorum]